MDIREFKGKKYDYDKVVNYNVKVEKRIEKIEDTNDRAMVISKGRGKESGYCTFCGAVRPSGDVGIGCGCRKIVEKFFKGYFYNRDFVTMPQNLTDNYFVAYKKYVRFVRALYLYNNTKTTT